MNKNKILKFFFFVYILPLACIIAAASSIHDKVKGKKTKELNYRIDEFPIMKDI